MCFIKVADIGKALEDCSQALNLDPSNAKAYQRMVTCNIALKKYHRAKAACKKGLQVNPDDKELKEASQKVQELIYKQNLEPESTSGKNPNLEDVEIKELISHPRIQQLFKDFQENPKVAQEAIMKDDGIRDAFDTLVAAGIIRTR